MWTRLRDRARKAWFDHRCRDIHRTPPLQCDAASPVVVVSQLWHPDMTMYLLAAKSFARFIRPLRFVIVDDGLTEDDRGHLRHHLGVVDFVPRSSVQVKGLPVGGCWERLVTLARENQRHYAVQLDADTLTLRPPALVADCVRQSRTFTMGTNTGKELVPVSQASRYARERGGDHVQIAAESVLAELDPTDRLLYVRGCAGFTGFAPGTLSVDRIASFSQRMEALLGAGKWQQWGSEQVTSNFMAANAAGSVVLPFDRYPFWGPGVDVDAAVLVHFFGTYRFTDGAYVRMGRACVAEAGACAVPATMGAAAKP